MLLTAVLASSLPWELVAAGPEDAGSFSVLATSSDDADMPQAPPATDLCHCLCMGGPGSAVEGVSTPLLTVAANVIRTGIVPPDQTHPSDVLSRLFRPPRSA